MQTIVFSGLNLAVVYGIGLIVFALILALIYNISARARKRVGWPSPTRTSTWEVTHEPPRHAALASRSSALRRARALPLLLLRPKAKSAAGYYAAGGKIHWAVNGISFAGDYLSAASFLGICGMIATLGYDGFLYSIGYLAGWIVALFVVAEPMKRMGKFTFTDALDAKFDSRGIKLAWQRSRTLVVSICYLIPQMNGAGSLVEPLLGLPHWVGVIIVGVIVIPSSRRQA
jgi:hypothetical protein